MNDYYNYYSNSGFNAFTNTVANMLSGFGFDQYSHDSGNINSSNIVVDVEYVELSSEPIEEDLTNEG